MENEILDLSFLYEISDNDPVYINEVIKLYLENVPPGIQKLKDLVEGTDDYDQIRKQAHFLKSSANIVKVAQMYDNLAGIEQLAREDAPKEKITEKLTSLLENFAKALPQITAIKKRTELITSKLSS